MTRALLDATRVASLLLEGHDLAQGRQRALAAGCHEPGDELVGHRRQLEGAQVPRGWSRVRRCRTVVLHDGHRYAHRIDEAIAARRAEGESVAFLAPGEGEGEGGRR